MLESDWSLLLIKVPEVKDTVHKHSLLYHLTFSVLESLPTASDLYSEIGPITRASRYEYRPLIGRFWSRDLNTDL